MPAAALSTLWLFRLDYLLLTGGFLALRMPRLDPAALMQGGFLCVVLAL